MIPWMNCLRKVSEMWGIPIGHVTISMQRPYFRARNTYCETEESETPKIELRRTSIPDAFELWIHLEIPEMKYSENYIECKIDKKQLIELRNYIDKRLSESD